MVLKFYDLPTDAERPYQLHLAQGHSRCIPHQLKSLKSNARMFGAHLDTKRLEFHNTGTPSHEETERETVYIPFSPPKKKNRNVTAACA